MLRRRLQESLFSHYYRYFASPKRLKNYSNKKFCYNKRPLQNSMQQQQQQEKFPLSISSPSENAVSGKFGRVDSKPIPHGWHRIVEGTASILSVDTAEAFYNPAQIINRDLSVVVMRLFNEMRGQEHEEREQKRRQKAEARAENKEGKGAPFEPRELRGLQIMEALSATGLRAIRYWKEIDGVERVIANDLSEEAVAAIRRNVEYNDLSDTCVVPSHSDAIDLLHAHRAPEKRFDIVDLDPYGSASIFLDPAVQSVTNGGLLCVTCTDLAVLAGNNASTCYAKYGAFPVRNPACHEQAVRIVLQTIQNAASRYKRYIVPLVSVYINFYVRMFVRVFDSAEQVKQIYKNMSHLWQCQGCSAFHLQPLGNSRKRGHYSPAIVEHGDKCEECGQGFKMGGPIWTGPLHDTDFARKCLHHAEKNLSQFDSKKHLTSLLKLVTEEDNDTPLFYVHDQVTSSMKAPSPPVTEVRSALLNAGYKLSRSHCDPGALKTDAPISVVHDIYRESYNIRNREEEEKKRLERLKNMNEKQKKRQERAGADSRMQIAKALRDTEVKSKVDFTIRKEVLEYEKSVFLAHPGEGPLKRARSGIPNRYATSLNADGNEKTASSDSPDQKKRKAE